MARAGLVVDEYLDDEGNGDQPRETDDNRLDCMGVYLDDRRRRCVLLDPDLLPEDFVPQELDCLQQLREVPPEVVAVVVLRLEATSLTLRGCRLFLLLKVEQRWRATVVGNGRNDTFRAY